MELRIEAERGGRMKRRTFISILGIGMALAVSIGLATSHGAPGAEHRGLSTVSNHGRVVALAPRVARAFGARSAQLLAVSDGRAFYRVATADGTCYAVGDAGEIGKLGGDVCPHGGMFPSAASPLLDLSVYESTSHDVRALTLWRAEGFAADGVAAIGIMLPSGAIAHRIPVRDNVYAWTHVPPGLAGALVALDAGGQQVSAVTR
jgi:hypothetical protein